jgi:hypothetical protein
VGVPGYEDGVIPASDPSFLHNLNTHTRPRSLRAQQRQDRAMQRQQQSSGRRRTPSPGGPRNTAVNLALITNNVNAATASARVNNSTPASTGTATTGTRTRTVGGVSVSRPPQLGGGGGGVVSSGYGQQHQQPKRLVLPNAQPHGNSNSSGAELPGGAAAMPSQWSAVAATNAPLGMTMTRHQQQQDQVPMQQFTGVNAPDTGSNTGGGALLTTAAQMPIVPPSLPQSQQVQMAVSGASSRPQPLPADVSAVAAALASVSVTKGSTAAPSGYFARTAALGPDLAFYSSNNTSPGVASGSGPGRPAPATTSALAATPLDAWAYGTVLAQMQSGKS